MSSITSGASIDLDGLSVQMTGIRELLRDAKAVGVAVEDLTGLTSRLATPIATAAKAAAPHKTGRLASGIKPSKSRVAVRVRVGSPKRLPYAAVNHWGKDSRTGPKWLTKAEERLRPQTFKGFGEGIKELLHKHNW